MSLLPLWLLHAVGWLLGWLVFGLSGVYRQRFLANARQAGVAPRDWLAAVGESGKLVTELPRLWLGAPVVVTWEGSQHIDAALAQGRGLVFLTPHLGCFEIAGRAYAERYGQSGKPITVLFRPPRQAWFREFVQASRQRPGLATAPTTLTGVRQLFKALKDAQCVGLLPDQVPPQGMGVMAPFFGRLAYTMTLSARLVQQSGAAVLLAWGERLPWGRGYTVHVRPLSVPLATDTVQAAAQINEAMAEMVMQCPQQYLWGYARYKSPREVS